MVCHKSERKRTLFERVQQPNPLRATWLIAGAISTAVATAAAAGPFFARAGLIDRQGAALPIFAIQSQDRGLGPFFGIHSSEREAARPSGDSIHDDIDLVHRAVYGKHGAQVVLGGIKGKIPNV